MAKPTFTENMKRSLAARNLSFKSIAAMVLFSLIILVFVFFGGFGNQSVGGGAGYAARVNDAYISIKDLDSESARVERSFGQMFGQLGGAQRSFVTNQALQSLIQGELIAQYSEKSRIYATDHEIKEVIVNELPYFQQEGRFRRELYEQILAANKMTPGEFEEKLRKDRKTQRVRLLLEASSSPLKLEVEKKKQLGETQMNFAFVKLEKAKVAETMSVPAAEVTAKLADPEFKKRVADEFSVNNGRYDTPEEVRAAHILIKTDPSNPESEAAALAKATTIQARAEKEDFGKLAAEFSEDTGSKANKGDLGFVSRGKMVPEFDAAMFSQPVGAVGAPVKTQFGYHIIKVLDKKEFKKAELATYENQIAKRLIAEDKYDGETKALEEKINAKDLAGANAILKNMNVAWADTGFVDLGSEFIQPLASREATTAAFKLTAANPLSGVIRDGTAKIIVQYKATNTKATEAPVNAQTFIRERSIERLTSWLEGVQKKARIERNPAVGANDEAPIGM